MRPPICAICDLDFRDDESKGEGVTFKLSDKDIEYNNRMEEKELEGHPAGFEWFCNKHLKIAQKYVHLTWEEAYPEIVKSSRFINRIISVFKSNKRD